MTAIPKNEQFQTVLASCRALDAEISVNPEQRYFTVMTKAAWNDPAVYTKSKKLQEQVRRLSKQYPNVVCYCFDVHSTLIYVI